MRRRVSSVFALRFLVVVVSALVIGSSSAAAQTLPTGWASTDIGAVGASGTASGTLAALSVEGAGADIWGTADAFRFAYTKLTGDGSVVAQVASIEYVDAWTKVGVMMRESLAANARHASIFVTPGKGIAFQRRASTGSTSSNTSASGAAPYYVKITRVGSTFTAYKSTNGTTWTKVGSHTISMPATVYVGTAVSSHKTGTLASALVEEAKVSASTTTTTTTTLTAPTTSTSTKLKVLHWNIHHGVGTDGKYDINRLATWMAKFNPDVISMNEVEKYTGWGYENQPARFAALLAAKTGKTWYHHFAQRSGSWSSNGQGNLILSRFPFVSTNQLALPCNRSAALATVSVNGRNIAVLSTHLDEASSSCRTSEVSAILSWVKNFSAERILAGDWNSQYSSSQVTSVTSGYYDAWPTAKSLGSATNYSGNCDGCTRNSRIDYAFHSRSASYLKFLSAQMFDTRDSLGKMPSDHKPMLTTYEVR